MRGKKVLIASLSSYDKSGKQFQRTAADQLKELFEKNNIPVIFTEHNTTRLSGLITAISTILLNYRSADIAVVPLFGTTYSFLWQKIIVWLLKRLKIKIVLIVHGGSIPLRMKNNPAKFLKAFRNADAVICPSPFMQVSLQQYNVPANLIENVLDIQQYKFYKKNKLRPRILWMRAFEYTYNPEMAVRAAEILAKKYSDFQMVMAGSDRGLLAPVKRLALQLNLADKIIFPGYLSLEQKSEYAKNYDICISTNRIDNAPVSFVEFMTMGLPVVSVDVGGISYMIKHGCNGLLAAFDNEKDMAEKIELLIENSDYACSIINNARKYAQQYDEPVVLQKWLHVFEELSS